MTDQKPPPPLRYPALCTNLFARCGCMKLLCMEGDARALTNTLLRSEKCSFRGSIVSLTRRRQSDLSYIVFFYRVKGTNLDDDELDFTDGMYQTQLPAHARSTASMVRPVL